MIISCKDCGKDFEYDEVNGNYYDGYICFQCSEEKINIKCDNCNKEHEVENDVIMKVCGCGYTQEREEKDL